MDIERLASERVNRREPPQCVFCNQAGASDEHVFGQWISAVFADAAPFTLSKTPGRSGTGLKKINVKSRAPCEVCNNGWMSRSEEEAKELLTPMFYGQEITWAREQQTRVARWAFKTALMLDRSSLASRVAPTEQFRYLYEYQAPPDSVSIYVARYFPGPGDEAIGVIGSSFKPNSGVDLRLYPDPYQITFSVGQAVFQVFGHSGTAHLEIRRLASLDSGVIIPLVDMFPRLWPTQARELAWPPPGPHLNTKSLQTLARF